MRVNPKVEGGKGGSCRICVGELAVAGGLNRWDRNHPLDEQGERNGAISRALVS